MKQKKPKRPVSPIYTVAVIWLLYSLFFHPVNTLGRLGLLAALSLLGYSVVRALVGSRRKQTAAAAAEPVEQPQTKGPETAGTTTESRPEPPKYPPEVQTVVDEGERAHKELERLYFTIPDLKVKRKIKEIMEISDKIIADAIDDPSDVPQIKKFLDYYLPTTIKLLNAYERMGAQGIEGQNITGTMKSINEMLDTAIDAYKKLLDSLFANQAMDVETDIAVMNTLLQREGFSGGGSAFQTKPR